MTQCLARKVNLPFNRLSQFLLLFPFTTQLAGKAGLEPATSRLTAECSATELLANKLVEKGGLEPPGSETADLQSATLPATCYFSMFGNKKFGADDENRTRNPLLGRQKLYQLSYVRICDRQRKSLTGHLRTPAVGQHGNSNLLKNKPLGNVWPESGA